MICLESVKKFCSDYEKIENYEQAINDTEMWVCHHRLETVFTRNELVKADWYLDRKPEELIFLRRQEHRGNPDLHIGVRRRFEAQKGKKLSEETKAKLSASHKGKKHSEEAKRKISEAQKGKKYALGCKRSSETRAKISASKKGHEPTLGSKGMHWFTNGITSVLAFECPEGFVKGRLKK